MMKQIVALFVPLALIFGSFVVPISIIYLLRKRYRRDRRSPLTAKLLRGAGQSVRHELDHVTDRLSDYLAFLLVAPFAVFSLHVSQSYFGGASESTFRGVVTALIFIVIIVYLTRQLYVMSRERFYLQCGLEAEVAMGEELGQLMRSGAVVFHDVPADQFNIDHVVLTRGGVFAVETKGRMKPDKGRGKQDATVEFNGTALRFPDWVDTKTIEQAKRQAAWLAKWVSKAIGEPVSVRPVVALPGWFVERTGRGDVSVISGREAPALLKNTAAGALPDQLLTRIAHQLEQRCRDVEPTQYGRQRRFGRHAREAA
jgi:hypothetical protein